MEELRTSLWSRLVVFYSVNKRDQLNSEVMAEIVAKYGSKEKELSARLLKKYGRPLPPSVPAQDLRRVLLEFGMEDQDAAGGAEPETAAAAPAAASPATAERTNDVGDRREIAGAARQEGGQGQGRGKDEKQAEKPPRGSELNFRSKFFDPLQALNHKTLRPPFPRERALDNLAKFGRLMPKRAAAAGTATGRAAGTAAAGGAVPPAEANPPPLTAATPKPPAAAAGATGAITRGASDSITQPGVQGRPAQDVAAAARDRSSAAAAPESAVRQGGSAGTPGGGAGLAAGSGQMSRRGTGESGIGGSIGGHYGPPVGSAAELERMDKEMASKRRNAELLFAGDVAAVPEEERVDPVQRIMREYVGKGPYSLLYRLHQEKRRASVMIRRVNSIRGTCTGLIRAFDRHMNLLLVDVREDYTAFVPARDPKPRSKGYEQRPPGAPSQEKGVGVGRGEEPGGNPADAEDVSSAASAPGVRAGVGGEGGDGVWGGGGGVSWTGGGSVSWGGGDGGIEEIKRVSHRHGMAARESDGREGVFGAEEVEDGGVVGRGCSDVFGSGGGGGDRGAVAAVEDLSGSREPMSAESVSVRNESPSFVPGEAQPFVGTTGVLGSRRTPDVHLAEQADVNNRGQGAGQMSRIGEVQPPPGEGGGGDRKRVGGQGQQGGFGHPPVEGGRSGGQENGGASRTVEVKKKSTRRSRGRGPWTGELVPVRQRRFLKQLLIRGDNVVMIWESAKR